MLDMKQILLFGILYLGLFNKSIGQSDSLKLPVSFILDSSKGPELLRQCSRAIPAHITAYWTLSLTDKINLEASFYKIESLTANECCILGFKLKTYKGFAFQYVGVIIKKRKYVYINAFPESELEEYLKMSIVVDISKSPMIICDGGSNYWGALYDIKTKTFSHLSFNVSL